MLPGRLGTLLVVAALGYFAIPPDRLPVSGKNPLFPRCPSVDRGEEPGENAQLPPLAGNRIRLPRFRTCGSIGYTEGSDPAFHGNAGTALDRSFYAKDMAHLGYPLILFEYPGYGARAGEMRESSLVSAAVEAARAALEQFGEPLYLLGESLGCGVASAVAGSGEVPVAGVVLITPWDSLPLLAQSVYWYLPAKWLTRDQYDNVRNLNHYRGPVAVAIAENDEVIPPRHGRRLYDLLTGRKKLWLLPGASHNNWPDAVDSLWWSEVMRFVAPQEPPGAALQ